MKATQDQVERIFSLRQQGVTKCNHLMRETRYSKSVIESAQKIIRQAENDFFAAQERNEKMDRLITFQRPFRDIERGKTRGSKGTPTDDRSPCPSGLPLLPFVCIVTEQYQWERDFQSHTLPAAQWVEPER